MPAMLGLKILLIVFTLHAVYCWEHCYLEDAGNTITVRRLTATLINSPSSAGSTAILLNLHAELSEPIIAGRYSLEIWHQETGRRINYKGPYDICCGFVEEGVPLGRCNDETDCPINDTLIGSMHRPLHTDYPGHYEATLKIFINPDAEHIEKEEEAVCVMAALTWDGHLPKTSLPAVNPRDLPGISIDERQARQEQQAKSLTENDLLLLGTA